MITSRDCTLHPISINTPGRDKTAPPIKDISRCPAIMFAVRRKVRANGRIILLKSSTTDMNLINPNGVPLGTKWERKSDNDFLHVNKIVASQKDKASGKVHTRCEVNENKWGNKAVKFKILTVMNIVPVRGKTPLGVFGNTYFTSLLRVDLNLSKYRGIWEDIQ